ncbi:MAG: hypothetical protein IJM62_03655 [Lachnospiraceae bacterium]|nr:hypothetical protein [Lachnospiraceae bacterium]
MKKTVVILLIFVMMLTGCSMLPSSDEKGGSSSKDSLWGKKFTIEKVPVPQEAFDTGGAEKCWGMTPDGDAFLMSGGVVPYLYDPETNTVTPLIPADDVTRETIREALKKQALDSGDLDQAALQHEYERIDALEGEDLTEAMCTQKGVNYGLRVTSFQFYTNRNYMLAYSANMNEILIDCYTGSYYSFGSGHIASAKDGTALYIPAGQTSVVEVRDLSVGTVTEIDLGDCGFEYGAAVRSAVFLDDGSICAVMRDMKQDLKNGEACVLLIRGENGESTAYPLGNILFGREPDIIMPVGNDYIIMASTAFARTQPVYMVDRKEGAVYLLVSKDQKIKALPLNGHLADNSLPEDISDEGAPFIPLQSMSDGETMLLWGLDVPGEMLLYHPSTRETQSLADPEYNGFPSPIYFNGNRYDRFWMNSWNDFTDYTQITITE